MLPDEIVLEILQYVGPRDLWVSARLCSSQMRQCVHELFSKEAIKSTTICLTYSLGNGTRHRWYDVRASVSFVFGRFDETNKDLVIFELSEVKPSSYTNIALRKWKTMATDGLTATRGSIELDWQSPTINRVAMCFQQLPTEGGTAILIDWKYMYARLFGDFNESTLGPTGTRKCQGITELVVENIDS